MTDSERIEKLETAVNALSVAVVSVYSVLVAEWSGATFKNDDAWLKVSKSLDVLSARLNDVIQNMPGRSS